MTTSPASLVDMASVMAANMRATMSRYGSPQLGRHGLRKYFQFERSLSAESGPRIRLPSNTFVGSMMRSSITGTRPKALATGAADSWVR